MSSGRGFILMKADVVCLAALRWLAPPTGVVITIKCGRAAPRAGDWRKATCALHAHDWLWLKASRSSIYLPWAFGIRFQRSNSTTGSSWVAPKRQLTLHAGTNCAGRGQTEEAARQRWKILGCFSTNPNFRFWQSVKLGTRDSREWNAQLGERER